eukprot:3949004-Amphidinium_carterae.1
MEVKTLSLHCVLLLRLDVLRIALFVYPFADVEPSQRELLPSALRDVLAEQGPLRFGSHLHINACFGRFVDRCSPNKNDYIT